MTKAMATFCAVVSMLTIVSCQVDTSKDDYSKDTPELMIVSDQLPGAQRYDIDLTRDDAVYFVAPNLDVSRLTITCPSLLTMSFAEYVVTRIGPTGVKYDPTTDGLRLANALVPREPTQPIAGQASACVVACWDEAVGCEQCVVCQL